MNIKTLESAMVDWEVSVVVWMGILQGLPVDEDGREIQRQDHRESTGGGSKRYWPSYRQCGSRFGSNSEGKGAKIK